MSSSTSPSHNPEWVYDVFLNFRGEDTRSNFVSHLHAALSNAGVNTFVDYQLDKGTELESELLHNIEGSHISIVVFSKRYTESSYCLNELEKIMKCRQTYGQVVVPIFYDVDPSVVRHMKGYFGKALRDTVDRRYSEVEGKEYVLSRWRNALTQTANLSGWDVNNCRSEGELIPEIVEDVLTKIQNTFLSITEFPVGLEPRVQQMTEFIENKSSDVCVIGIWGMGGSGKTTTAKAIYNRIHRKFLDRSFIESIREVCEKGNRGHIHLQEQLLSDILKTKEKIHSIAMGTILIEKRLRGKKALVVLDDVTTSEQLKVLCGNPKLFASGSVLIVTTRDVRLLSLLSADYVCTMTEMDKNESLELFSWHAFRQPSPKKDFRKHSKNVVAYCGGLPLALEILGSYLFEREKKEWKGVLSKLERIPNDQVQQILRISYDGLEDDTEKDIFLDICCFFIGEDMTSVIEILNGCGLYANIGIAVLIERSLVKVGKNNKLRMHDLLRDMGREIVRESSVRVPARRSRLWFHGDVHDVLTKNTGTENVEGLVLKSQSTSRVCFGTDSFKEMKKLRLLQLDHVDLIGDYGYLSKDLRWLHWRGFNRNYMPDEFCQENLVVLDLKYSNLKHVWNEAKLLEKLKVINLSHSKYLRKTPDFSKLPNLEKLIMKDCPSLLEIDQSIGDLKNVVLINLKDCTGLRNLPRKIYQLKSVKTLILSGCSKIEKLEEDIVQMESLTTLIAKDTSIKEVPSSLVRSKSIRYISLCGYEGLSRDVFPSLIWSWMSPNMNSLPHTSSAFGAVSISLVSLDVSVNLGYLSPRHSSLSELEKFGIQYRLEVQVTPELIDYLDDLFYVNITEMETTTHALQSSGVSLRSVLMGMGSCQIVISTLGTSRSQYPEADNERLICAPVTWLPLANHFCSTSGIKLKNSESTPCVPRQVIQPLGQKVLLIHEDSDEENESPPSFKRCRQVSKLSNEEEREDIREIPPPIEKKLKIQHSRERKFKTTQGSTKISRISMDHRNDHVKSFEETISSFQKAVKGPIKVDQEKWKTRSKFQIPEFSIKSSKRDYSSDDESTSYAFPITSQEKSNSLRKEIENPQQSLPLGKNKVPDATEAPSDYINNSPHVKFVETCTSTSIPLTSPEVKQDTLKESISNESRCSKPSTSKDPTEKVYSKEESVPEYSPVDYSKYNKLIEEDPLAMMEKLLSGEINRSSKTTYQSTNQAETTGVERESIGTLLDDLRHLVFSRNFLKYLQYDDLNLRENVKDLLCKLEDRVDELSEKQVLGLVEFTKIFKRAMVIIDEVRTNADSLHELEVNHKNSISRLQASKEKIKRFGEAFGAGQNKIKDIDYQIEDMQIQIREMKERVYKLSQEKSLLKDTCSKCQEKRVKLMKEVQSISSDAVQILEKTSHLEKKEREFDSNYKRLEEHYTKMKSAPPF